MIRDEFIGKRAVITYAGSVFDGIIIDETRNTLRLKTEDRQVTIIKQNAKITINNTTISGDKITKRPEDRIKLR